MNLGRSFRVSEKATINIRMELTNVFNRAFWTDPTGDYKTLPQYLANGNTAAGFGRIITTGTISTANVLPRQGLLVARITF